MQKHKGQTIEDIPEITLKERAFILPLTLEINATSWDTFFREIRNAFLVGILNVSRDDIERARHEIVKSFNSKGMKISSTDRASCFDLIQRMGGMPEDKFHQFHYLDSVILWIEHIVTNRVFDNEDARIILYLFSDITWYSAMVQIPFRDAYLKATRGRPKKYMKERDLLYAKDKELREKGKTHSSYEVLEAVEKDRGRRFPATMRSKLLEAWTTEIRRGIALQTKHKSK